MVNDRKCEEYRYNSTLKRIIVERNIRGQKHIRDRRNTINRDDQRENVKVIVNAEEVRSRYNELVGTKQMSNRVKNPIMIIESYADIAGRSSRIAQERQ